MCQTIESRILEYNILFTHDIRKKLKKWIDGRLRHYKLNDKVQVLSEDGIVITEQFMLKADFSDESKWDGFIKVGSVLVQIDCFLCELRRDVIPSKKTDQTGNNISALKVTKSDAFNVVRGNSQLQNSSVSTSEVVRASHTLTPTPAASKVRRRVGLSKLHTPSKRRTGIKPVQTPFLSRGSPRGNDIHSTAGIGKSNPSALRAAPRLQDPAKCIDSSHSSVLSVDDVVPSPTLNQQHHQVTPITDEVSKLVTGKGKEASVNGLKVFRNSTGAAAFTNGIRTNLRIASTSDRWAEKEQISDELGDTDCPDSTQTSRISWGTQDPDPSVFASELANLHKASASCDSENAQSEQSGGLPDGSSADNNYNKQGCIQNHQELLPRRPVSKPRVGRRGRAEAVRISPIHFKSEMK